MPGWLRVVVSLLLVAALAFYVDLGQVGRILASSRPDLVVCLVALATSLRLLSAYRWFVLLRTGRPDLSLMRIVRISFVSVFAGTFLPGGIGGEAVRIYGAARASSDLALAFSSAVVERAFGLFALLVMVATGLSLGPPGLPHVLRTWALAGLLGLAAGAWLMMAHRPRARITAWLSRWPILAPVNNRLRKLYDRMDLFAGSSVLTSSFLLSFVLQFARVLAAFVAARALHVDVPFASLLVVVPAGMLVSSIPVSIGGLGLREGTMVSLLGMVGVAPAAGLALSVLMLAAGFVSTLPGAIFLAQRRAHPT
ncbi:MAG TPA: lysylphosphatidylglycerol synthase transmembrane domain-containing protein [Geminicoccaceae bacterium]|nr:lysylphosphatidylglycerol synthase transmembrane domain-containing protein [Geminicoccaceae bacterium]